MIKTFYFNDLRTCCYILWDDTKECAIVDPGCISDSERNRLVKFIEENELQPKMIINTHGHFDHIMGNVFVGNQWNIPTYLNKEDLPLFSRTSAYCEMFGYKIDQPSDEVVDLSDGDMINIGNICLKVIHTPGHTLGGVVLYNAEENYVLTGDSIFEGSIGRTDLPGGDYDTLMDSIENKIISLPSETIIYPGHGPSTTVGKEVGTNPFLERLGK